MSCLRTLSHIHIRYSRRGSRREGAIPFVHPIARTDEQSQLLDITRKLIEFQYVVRVNLLAMTTCSQAHVCHGLRIFTASCESGRILLVYLGFPDLHAGHVHTSWNPSNIWISLL
jgi:hypothetical protein